MDSHHLPIDQTEMLQFFLPMEESRKNDMDKGQADQGKANNLIMDLHFFEV